MAAVLRIDLGSYTKELTCGSDLSESCDLSWGGVQCDWGQTEEASTNKNLTKRWKVIDFSPTICYLFFITEIKAETIYMNYLIISNRVCWSTEPEEQTISDQLNKQSWDLFFVDVVVSHLPRDVQLQPVS